MGFKIKKSLLAGTSGHKKATDRQIKINRAIDNSSLPDGRAKSSAFQLVSDKDKDNKAQVTETWKKPTTTTTVTPNDKGGENTTVRTDQEGTKTTTTENKDLTTFKQRCAKYNKKNSAAAKADGCVWAENVKDPKPDVKTEPLSKTDSKTTSTEKKKPPVEEIPEDDSSTKQDPCPNYAKHKARCAKPYNGKKIGVFNETTCRCARDKKLITKITDPIKNVDLSKLNIFKKRYKNKCNKSNYGSTLCSNLKSSIKSAMNP